MTGKVAIVPRWEWRAFAANGHTLHGFETLAVAEPEKPAEETYLLSTASDHAVKVRNGRLEIKKLTRTDDTGLQLWKPFLSTEFSLDHEELMTLLDAWATRDLCAVSLTKRRTRLAADGCSGELVEVFVRGVQWWSVAFKDTDPHKVRAVIKHLSLEHLPNTSYPSALKRITGHISAGTARRISIGSD